MSNWSIRVNTSNEVNRIIPLVAKTLLHGLQKGAAVLTLTRPTRTIEQNRLMWPLLRDCATQIKHNGMKLSAEDWKDLMTVGFEGVQRSAPSLDGTGLVFFGVSTRKYPKDTFSAFIEFIYASGTELGVKWSRQSQENYSEVSSGSC